MMAERLVSCAAAQKAFTFMNHLDRPGVSKSTSPALMAALRLAALVAQPWQSCRWVGWPDSTQRGFNALNFNLQACELP
jgi:hypothetical protein